MRLLAAGVRLGSYEIVELVGRGGMVIPAETGALSGTCPTCDKSSGA
jgi:hypothetical protein